MGYCIHKALMSQHASNAPMMLLWTRRKLAAQGLVISLIAVPTVMPHLGLLGLFFRPLSIEQDKK